MKLDIQKFAGATINGSSTSSNCSCRIVWTSTTQGSTPGEKSALNKSNVTATIQIYKSGSSSTTGTFSGSITINGVTTSVSKKFSPYNWGSWATVGSATVNNIEHGTDGKKTIAISGTLTQSGTSMAGTYSASGNAKLDDINRISNITKINKTKIDSPWSIEFPNYGLYYDLEVIYFDPTTSQRYTVKSISNVVSGQQYSFEESQIQNLYSRFTGTSGIELTYSLQTYADEGRTIPIREGDAWVGVGATFEYGSIPPTATITITGEQNSIMKNLNWGIYVQGKSQIGVNIGGTAQYNATILSQSSSTNGINYNSASYTTGTITAAGDNLIKATVTDSRGQRSAEVSSSYYVYPYAQPSITLHSAERCDADGTVADSGSYLKLVYTSNIYSCNNKNSKSISVYAGNYSSVISTSYSNNRVTSIVNANLSESQAYAIYLRASDSFVGVNSNTINLSTGFDLMHWHKSGKAMAIGGKSTAGDNERLFEVDMKSKVKDLYADRIESYGTSGEYIVRANSNGNDIYLFANQNNIGISSSSRASIGLDNSGSGWNLYGNATTATTATNQSGGSVNASSLYCSDTLQSSMMTSKDRATTLANFYPDFLNSKNGIRAIRNNNANCDFMPLDGSGVAWASGDTHGFIYASWGTPDVYVGGGNDSGLTWTGKLPLEDDLFFKSGDTITLTDFIANGFITSSTTNVYVDVVLPKRIDGLTVRATSASAEIRGQKGYLNSTSGNVQYVGKSGYTIDIYKTISTECNKIALRIKKSSAWTNVDNNSMVSAFFENLTLSFS